MKILLQILPIVLLFLIFSACSHSSHLTSTKKVNDTKFTLENKTVLKRSHVNMFQVRLSSNTTINVNVKSIADFIQPISINQTPKLLFDGVDMHPWALCTISF